MPHSQIRGTTLMLLATLCLASSTFLAKYIYREHVGPLTMLTLRFVLAAFLLWLFYLTAKDWRPYIGLQSKSQLWNCVAVGAANALSQTLYSIALTKLDPGLAQMIFSCNPAMVALIMLFFGERLTGLTSTRLTLALAGLYLLTLVGGNSGRSLYSSGVPLLIGCAAVYAVHLVLYQKLLGKTSSRTNTLYILSAMALSMRVRN